MTALDEAPLAPPAAARRRWSRGITASGIGLASAAAGATGGLGWYFASQLITVDHTIRYPIQVHAVRGDTVTLSRDQDTEKPALLGLFWPAGHALLGPQVALGGATVTRTVEKIVAGALRPGTRAYTTSAFYDGDPLEAHGLAFNEVPVLGELGPMPAWHVPADGPTWLIAVHGRGARRREALRILPVAHTLGLHALVITYRNDVGAPASPDRRYHLGDTEWNDVAAAIRHALAHGARDVILYGWSMGGAAVLTALRRLDAATLSSVRAVVLDCPVIDWATTLRRQATQRRIPPALTWTALRMIEMRAGLRLAELDHRPFAVALPVPTLIFVDMDDVVVHPEPAIEFAGAAGDRVTLARTRGGGHCRSWNVDPSGYEAHLADFVKETLSSRDT